MSAAVRIRLFAAGVFVALLLPSLAIAEPVEATALGDSARGDGGFGSTGLASKVLSE